MMKEQQRVIENTLIIEIQYLPCIWYFKTLYNYTNVKIEQYEYWQKMSFRNRCLLSGPNGILSLSIPLEKGRSQRMPVKDVRIAYKENWRLIHWRTIHDAYRKSPFFEWYMDDIKTLFDTRPVFLFDWNRQWLEWLISKSGITITPGLTDAYVPHYGDGYTDFRDKITPKTYLNYKDSVPVYTQVFSHKNPFLPNLSFLDFLLCEGGQAFHRMINKQP